MPTLIAQSGPLAGKRIDVDHDLTVGRVDGDLVIEDAKLSRRHAIFRVVGDGLEAEDLGSTNGTFVGDRRIDAPTPLRDGDEVRLGTSKFAVEIPLVVIEATQIDRTIVDRTPEVDDRTEIHPRATEAALGATEIRPATAAPIPPPSSPTPPPAPAAAAAPAPVAPPAARPSPAAPIAGAPAPGAQLGVFAPPPVKRGGLATRSWVPVAASYGSAIAVAIALIIYFVSR